MKIDRTNNWNEDSPSYLEKQLREEREKNLKLELENLTLKADKALLLYTLKTVTQQVENHLNFCKSYQKR